MTRKPKPKARKRDATDECNIPPPIPLSALPGLVLPRNADEVRQISEYVEWQSRADGETVIHAEKISEEYVMGRKHECWDVHTNKSQL